MPSVGEAGLSGFVQDAWNGLMAPARTPPAIIKKLNREISVVMKMPALRERFAAEGVEAGGMSPEELAAMLRSEIAKWSKVVRQAGIKPE